MLLLSGRSLLKEQRLLSGFLAPGERKPPWYTNALLCKQSEAWVDGVLLISLTIGFVVPFPPPQVFGVWEAVTIGLFACSRVGFLLAVEAGKRRLAHEKGEDFSSLRPDLSLYQELAVSLVWLGVGGEVLLTGFNRLNLPPPAIVNWLGIICIVVGGCAWVVVRLLSRLKAF